MGDGRKTTSYPWRFTSGNTPKKLSLAAWRLPRFLAGLAGTAAEVGLGPLERSTASNTPNLPKLEGWGWNVGWGLLGCCWKVCWGLG